ncbi:Folate carrier, cyanobacterial type [Bathymodiolus brooksi thiotrophic gill symbiont]|nr:Folate carrier, cyanobacterial type [Bathymodiolus brooksi thiotrophic gill symbiont]CAB9542779.1 Folate carrier, cyanobacterial type [Bathymodiolus brooksi thiotrophic gill symbiont]CAC9597213.1 Folate carrier, cyanobacterial type [uncultured Gammaproteobacteria bacterium]CAC9971786.1 Folate carrier, cyanobacterial type [uncultured Gammaproteobacteria bacterium]
MLDILLTPIKAMRLRYVPLLLVYFSYGSSVFTAIAESFWVKETLEMSAADLAELGIWLTVPWTVKMIFGSLVDSVLIFGSNRKSYVYLGALLITLSSLMMIAVVGDYPIVAEFSKKSVYIFASVIAMVGFVMQDVVADTMSTEVVDKSQSKEEIHRELASIQILARLSLGFAIFITGWVGGELASVFKDNREVVFMIAMFVPFLSILGVTLVSLNPVPVSKVNRQVLFGGLIFALFVVTMGYAQVPYSQEIVFVFSLSIVLYLLNNLIADLSEDAIRHIKMAMIIIFVYRAMPSVGASLQWWQIDVLGFDESFFAKLSAIGGGIALAGMWFSAKFIVKRNIAEVLIFLTIIGTLLSLPIVAMYYDIHTMLGVEARTVALIDTALASPFDYIAQVLMLTLVAIHAPEGKKGTWFALMASLMNIALSAGGLLTKYLNKIFVVSREVITDGVVTTAQDYTQLGDLLWVAIIAGFVIPIVVIIKFNPSKA